MDDKSADQDVQRVLDSYENIVHDLEAHDSLSELKPQSRVRTGDLLRARDRMEFLWNDVPESQRDPEIGKTKLALDSRADQ